METNDTQHFNKLFWFCVCCVAIGVIFLFALCFFTIPKSSERFADNCQGFFQGSIITAAISFLLGGNIPTTKKGTTVTATGDSPVINAQPNTDDITRS